jgi:predicted transposase/invertase (TIGR01784 family)
MDQPPELRHPHDAFFKETFGRTEIAADYLRHYLPPAVAARLRLEALEPQRDTFVDPDLQEHFSDLLYRVPLVGTEEQEHIYVYTLFEHKSYADKFVAYQLLRYMLRIWKRTLAQEQRLVPILPIVLYHGERGWPVDTRFDALFVGPEELRAYWPSFAFHLTDLSQYSDEQIRGAVGLQGVLLLLKHIHDEDVTVHLAGVVRLLADLLRQERGVEWLYTFLRYVSAAGQLVEEAELRQIVESVFPQRSQAIMATLAEKWLEAGKKEGREEGREEGVRNSILTVLRVRFAVADQEFEPIVQKLAEVPDLQRPETLLTCALQDDTLAHFLRHFGK